MNSKTFILATVFLFILIPILALANSAPLVYKPLVGIPGIGTSNSFGEYINALYGLSIAVAALMAVIKIIIAGVKYMLSDVVTSKQEAIGDIRGSLLGLGIVISAVLVLTIINPQLAETEIFIDPITNTSSRTSVAPTAETPKTGRGYTYIPAGSNPGFKSSCNVAAGYHYTLASAGSYEVCYAPLPPAEIAELNAIFQPTASFNLNTIIKRYQEAHRPRLIPSGSAELTRIANESNSKNKTSADVLLAVTFKGNPYLDWIDAANAASISDTCLQFQRAATLNNTTSETIKIQKVGSPSLGYFACVRMP